MTDQAPPQTVGYLTRLKQRRRKAVRRFGMRRIRQLAEFQGRQSKIGDRPILDRTYFDFLGPFEEGWVDIRRELDEILRHRDAIPLFQEVSPAQKKISKGENWRTFILYGFGTPHEKNCARMPVTTSLLQSVPNLQTAWFSILSPRYHIPPHRGVTKGIVRCHMGMKIPSERELCRMRVGDEMCVWKEGELFVFDDTYEHEVWNDTDDERVVLIFDFDRPMRFWGRLLNKAFVAALKQTAYYREPKRNMATFDARFEAAVDRANTMIEEMDDELADR
ncbi:MAG: aspartyl/asparaginyl beta-hydroxylase domain-containing protein [Alphaproteobacteria bacterium]|nr:aspartyl/asparaginyl beta-hydroxylase domain-containing protein [Alphaproteobacteria bacterium]